MESLRRGDEPLILDPAIVTCSECRKAIGEDEAQAVRWGYWAKGIDGVYPFCFECAGCALDDGQALYRTAFGVVPSG